MHSYVNYIKIMLLFLRSHEINKKIMLSQLCYWVWETNHEEYFKSVLYIDRCYSYIPRTFLHKQNS